MIRSKKLSASLLDAWLPAQSVPVTHATYRLRLWKEDPHQLSAVQSELLEYVQEAFDDAKQRIRRGFQIDLSPFTDPLIDPAAHYPDLLHRVTLQGYFGEIAGVLAIEHWGAFGRNDWIAPAFLFRMHDQEFQHLELIHDRIRSGATHDPDDASQRRPGRTGDDGVAFRIGADSRITDVATIEAKCVGRNDTSAIRDAHEKLGAGLQRPSGIRELINILCDYDTDDADKWRHALLILWSEHCANATRGDVVAYVCGCSPKRGTRKTWLDPSAPNAAYSLDRHLEAIEIHLADLDSLINRLFRTP